MLCLLSEPSVMMFKKGTQTFTTADPKYTIPVVRTRNLEGPASVHWRTRKASRFEVSGPLKFGPGESEKNIVIDARSHPGPINTETFQLELFEPGPNAAVGERKTTLVNVTDPGERSHTHTHTHTHTHRRTHRQTHTHTRTDRHPPTKSYTHDVLYGCPHQIKRRQRSHIKSSIRDTM